MNKTLPANPLQSVLKAAAALPANGRLAARRQRLAGDGQCTVILADVSGSMAEPAGGRLKIDILQDAVDAVLPARPQTELLAFASLPTAVKRGARLPGPSGGTALHLALEAAASLNPRHTIIISDGKPDSRGSAMAAAKKLPGIIDVIYVGTDGDREAIDFLHTLAAAGGGHMTRHDLVRTPELVSTLRRHMLIEAPK